MARPAVNISVGGKSYRLVSDAGEERLRHLAECVDDRLKRIGSRHPDALLLVALELVNDVEELEEKLQHSRARSREMLTNLLKRVDDALDHVDENGERLASVHPEADGHQC